MVYKGTANALIEHIAFEAAVKLTSNEQDGVLVPGFEVVDIEISLPDDNLSVSVKGNMQAQFATFFKLLFTDVIKPSITEALTN